METRCDTRRVEVVEKSRANRWKRRVSGEEIVSLFERARLKATALRAVLKTHRVYRSEETGTATTAITKKPLATHTELAAIFHAPIRLCNMCIVQRRRLFMRR